MEGESFNFSNFSTFVENGKVRKIGELEEYLKKVEKENITYKEKLEIGQEVKLKGIDYTVIVKYIDYQIPDLGKVDYAGPRSDGADERLRLFNQKDIEKVISTKKEKDDEEIEP